MGTLRPLETEDLLTLNSWRGKRVLRNETHGFRFPVSLQMDREWYERNVINAAPQKAIYAIQTKSGSFVGLAQLDRIDSIHRHAVLGLYIGDPEHRGQGVGKQAVKELVKFGFMDLNLNKIFLHVNKSNVIARKLYKKLGFMEEGDLRRHYYNSGKWEDVIVMAIFADTETE